MDEEEKSITETGVQPTEEARNRLPQETPRLDLSIRLTEEEILTCLRIGSARRAGKARLIVQSVLLILMAAYCAGAFFLSGMQSVSSLLIGLAALAVMVLMLVVPEGMLRHYARKEKEQDKCVRLRAYDSGLFFGSDETAEGFSYRDCRAVQASDLLLLRFQGGLLIGVPRRLTDDEGWNYLLGKLLPSEEK